MLKVFIADDEPFIIEGLYDMIDWEALGLEIIGHAENGQLAMDALRNMPPDILITDISMPVMNGLQLIAGARECHPELKVIVLSGYNEFEYLREGMKLGIENYLLKPINVEELKETLRNTIRKLNSIKAEVLFSKYSVQIMKDNTLYRRLTGRISDAEFNERAELLGIKLLSPYGIISVLRYEPETPQDFEETFDQVATFFGNMEEIVPFRDMDGDIVFVTGLRSLEVDKMAFLLTLAELRGKLVSLRGARLSLGRVYPLQDGISSSYEEAKKTQEYFLMYPEREWLDYGDTDAFRQTNLSEFPIDWTDYVKLLVAREKEKLHQRITEDFELIRRKEGVSPSYLREIAVELIVRFKMELKEIKHSEEPELYSMGFDRVKTAADYGDLAEAVRLVAARCVDSLVRDVRSPVVRQVLNEIHEHYAGELSLKSLGSKFHIHPVYLGRLFHKETNDSFTEYINKYRIEKAKDLLKGKNLKVHEIARNVGYWETGYFYKQFKKYVGVSPMEFKSLM